MKTATYLLMIIALMILHSFGIKAQNPNYSDSTNKEIERIDIKL